MTTSRTTTRRNEPFVIFPPVGSPMQTTFRASLEEAKSAAFDIAAQSPQEEPTRIVERTRASYRDVGHVTYLGLFVPASVDPLTAPALSRTAAKRQAHHESCMYRQGSGWIVSTWDPTVCCNRVTGEMAYTGARQTLADWRRDRAHRLQHGYPLDGAGHCS